MDSKVIDHCLSEVDNQNDAISNEIQLTKKSIRIENEKIQTIEKNIYEQNIEYEKNVKQIDLINEEKVHLSKHINAMKANIECLKTSCDQINEVITCFMTESEDKAYQQKQQLDDFNKIKDEYSTKLHLYRQSYESTDLGKVYANKTSILSQINQQIQSMESQLKQLQADSFKHKCENTRVAKEHEVFLDPIQIIKEIASIKLDTECVKVQIDNEIQRIQTQDIENIENIQSDQTNQQIESEVIEENMKQVQKQVEKQMEKQVVEEKSTAQNDPSVEISNKTPTESLPPTDYSSSFFGFQLSSPQKSVRTTPISTSAGFSFGKEFQKTNPSTHSKTDSFLCDSFFGNSSPKDSSVNNNPMASNIDPIFGNFGQSSPKNDSPFNFNFGNTSNESNGSNSPLMWK